MVVDQNNMFHFKFLYVNDWIRGILYKNIFYFSQNVQPQSLVWGRTDGGSLPANVVQEGNDLVFRNPSGDQGGNYICTVTHPDGHVERINVYVEYRPGNFFLRIYFHFNDTLYF